jgi:F0F1-type ATP synthase membrane subunit c/vacuolar-type H+-ATPase subunit K
MNMKELLVLPFIFIALAIALMVKTALESIGKNPEAADKVRGSLLLGLVFTEVTALLVIFVVILVVMF